MLPDLLTLHQTRMQKLSLEQELEVARNALYATAEYAEVRRIESAITESGMLLKQQRDAISEWAIQQYTLDGNKHPTPGVDIRVSRKVITPEVDTREWCIRNLATALVVDNKVFNDIMLKLEKSNPVALPGFVRIVDEPSATIATDLSKHLLQEV